MTQEMVDIIEYFENKKLPATFSHPGVTMNNCNKFVETQIIRIKEGAPINQRTSYEALKDFKKRLEAAGWQ